MKTAFARFLQNPSLAALPIIGLLATAVAVAAVFGAFALRQTDDFAIDRQGDVLVQTFASHAEQVARQEVPQIFWQDAAEMARARNYSWLHDNYGVYDHDVFGVRENHVLDSADQPIYSAVDGEQVDVAAYARLARLAGRLINEVRSFTPGEIRRTGLVVEMKKLPDGTVLPLLIAARLEVIDGRPSIVSVSTIIPDLDASVLAGEPPYLLVAVRDVDDDMLATIARDYGYAGLQWGGDTDHGRVTRVLTNDVGRPIGVLSWLPDRPSEVFLEKLKPAIVAALFVLICAGIIATVVARRFAMTLASEREKAWAATHDPLTGLPNRRFFVAELARIHAEHLKSALPLALLSIDLDRFKELNDGFGHAVGDEALRLSARRIEAAVGSGQLVARVGGDEFQVVLTGESVAEVAAIAAGIIERVAEPMDVAVAVEARLGCSVGIAVAGRGEVSDLVRQADLAVSAAKTSGRNRFEFFNPTMEEGLRRRIEVERDLRTAIQTGQLSLAYQPIYSSRSGHIIGAEALLRWWHPTRGFISPAAFIPVAESTGLVSEIGNFVLARACADAAEWHTLSVSINVSALQILNSDIVERVRQTLRLTGVSPERLELELTETALVRDEDRAAATIAALRDLGVGVALDDLGTGYSSLAHIRRFAFSRLKIDRSLIADIGIKPGAGEIVFSIINIARALNMSVTAEGVENEEQRRFLVAAGCETLQGFLFAAAMPGEEFARFAGMPQAARSA